MDLPERRKRYTSSREEDDVDAHVCPCDTTLESKTHVAGEHEIYKEERDVLEEEMRKLDECDMEEFRRPLIREWRENDGYHRRYMVATDGETGRE